VALVDEVSFEQMRSLLAGTLVRGTASRMRDLAGVVAGKTGTTNSAADVWFVGFTNDVTIGVWLGYDNDSRESRRTLGDDATGGQWAVPIFEEIVRASFASYKPKTNLRGPRAELAAQTVVVRTSSRTGDMVETGDLSELYRMDTRNRQPFQSQYRFVSRDEHLAALEAPASPDRTNPNQGWGAVSEEPGSPGRPLDLRPRPVQPKAPRPWWEIFFGAAEDDRDTQRARQRRYDPMFRYERPSDGTSNN
jgi:membrane carboxypeptidase/penicillin-binding protein